MIIRLSIKHNVAPCFFEYIGYTETLTGRKLHQFNIMDKDHINYMSTVAIFKEK